LWCYMGTMWIIGTSRMLPGHMHMRRQRHIQAVYSSHRPVEMWLSNTPASTNATSPSNTSSNTTCGADWLLGEDMDTDCRSQTRKYGCCIQRLE